MHRHGVEPGADGARPGRDPTLVGEQRLQQLPGLRPGLRPEAIKRVQAGLLEHLAVQPGRRGHGRQHRAPGRRRRPRPGAGGVRRWRRSRTAAPRSRTAHPAPPRTSSSGLPVPSSPSADQVVDRVGDPAAAEAAEPATHPGCGGLVPALQTRLKIRPGSSSRSRSTASAGSAPSINASNGHQQGDEAVLVQGLAPLVGHPVRPGAVQTGGGLERQIGLDQHRQLLGELVGGGVRVRLEAPGADLAVAGPRPRSPRRR